MSDGEDYWEVEEAEGAVFEGEEEMTDLEDSTACGSDLDALDMEIESGIIVYFSQKCKKLKNGVTILRSC